MLIHQNLDAFDFFNRSWAEFKVGFKNTSRGNYWIGNDLLHQLTSDRRYKLRFDLQAINGSWYYAEYSRFTVSSEASNYTMKVSGGSGNAGDALSYNDGMMFTTYDRDNDERCLGNCAVIDGGGFWHRNCVYGGVNVKRGGFDDFMWRGRVAGGVWYGDITLELQSTRMWLIC